MKTEPKELRSEIQNFLFEEPTEMFDYWGENRLIDMLDFCNRNNLLPQKKTLINLMKTDRIKL